MPSEEHKESLKEWQKRIDSEIDILKIEKNELMGEINDLGCLFENHYHKDYDSKLEKLEDALHNRIGKLEDAFAEYIIKIDGRIEKQLDSGGSLSSKEGELGFTQSKELSNPQTAKESEVIKCKECGRYITNDESFHTIRGHDFIEYHCTDCWGNPLTKEDPKHEFIPREGYDYPKQDVLTACLECGFGTPDLEKNGLCHNCARLSKKLKKEFVEAIYDRKAINNIRYDFCQDCTNYDANSEDNKLLSWCTFEEKLPSMCGIQRILSNIAKYSKEEQDD